MSGRCSIFDRIDALANTKNHSELLEALMPILNELAYTTVTEGGVSEVHEEWHEKYTARLNGEVRGEFASGLRKKPEPPTSKILPGEPAKKPEPPRARKEPGAGRGRSSQPRLPEAALPASLQALMQGPNARFDENDLP